MAQTHLDRDALNAAHHPEARITLRDGTVVQLYFGIRGQFFIEDKYENVADFGEALTPTAKNKNGDVILDDKGQPMAKMPSVKTLVDGIVFGAWRYNHANQQAQITIDRLLDPDAGLDETEVVTYLNAVSKALELSFPKEMQEAAAKARAEAEAAAETQSGPTSQPASNLQGTQSETPNDSAPLIASVPSSPSELQPYGAPPITQPPLSSVEPMPSSGR